MLELQRWLYNEAGAQLKSFANGIDPPTLLMGISIAALFGLVHAFMPGHGKTVLVSYFLGRPSKVVAGLSAICFSASMISIGLSVTAARNLAEGAASFFFPVTTLSVTTVWLAFTVVVFARCE
jgi:ABC-type nickel/cobalt efflux system permease component RcnA